MARNESKVLIGNFLSGMVLSSDIVCHGAGFDIKFTTGLIIFARGSHCALKRLGCVVHVRIAGF
jgi:hypothetical protein